MNDEDPMAGADVGETRTITETQEMYLVDIEPDVFWRGGDRYADSDITHVEIDKTGDSEVVRLTWEGEVTKTLPRYWDDPMRTQYTKPSERGLTGWKKYAVHAIASLVPLAAAFFVGLRVMNKMSGMTLNGEPVQPVGPGEFAATFAVFAAVAAILYLGVNGALPRVAGGRQ